MCSSLMVKEKSRCEYVPQALQTIKTRIRAKIEAERMRQSYFPPPVRQGNEQAYTGGKTYPMREMESALGKPIEELI